MLPEGIEFRGPLPAGAERSSRPRRSASSRNWRDASRPTRQELLRRRVERQQEIVDGRMPDFLPETAAIRKSDWTVAPIPDDLRDRRVEITGPVDRKMIINALNSGANVFMADFEDSNSPTWRNNIEGQINLRDAVRREISFASPEGKQYRLNANDRDSVGAPARLASRREAHAGGRRSRSRPRCSISACSFSITRPRSSSAARARISICRRWKATSKRACGTTSSRSASRSSAFRTAPFARRF